MHLNTKHGINHPLPYTYHGNQTRPNIHLIMAYPIIHLAYMSWHEGIHHNQTLIIHLVVLHHKSYHTSMLHHKPYHHIIISIQGRNMWALRSPNKHVRKHNFIETSIFTSKLNLTQRYMFMWMHDLPLLTLQQLNIYDIMHKHMIAWSWYWNKDNTKINPKSKHVKAII